MTESSAPSSDAVASSPIGDAARIPMTDEAVLALLRQHLTGLDSIYFCPTIPGKKELAARRAHARHLPSDERVLALFDDTVFGSGDEGFLVTSQRLCWKNNGDRARMLDWQHVDPDRMYADRRRLALGSGGIEISGDESITLALEEAFHVLAFSARTRPPVARSGVVLSGPSADDTGLNPIAAPQTTPAGPRASDRPTFRPSHGPGPMLESTIARRADAAYECWHCHAPVDDTTPECAHCRARPAPTGWLHTG